jgi:hypothetical protein
VDYVIYFEFQPNGVNSRELAVQSTGYGVQTFSSPFLGQLGGCPMQQIMILGNGGAGCLDIGAQISYISTSSRCRQMSLVSWMAWHD